MQLQIKTINNSTCRFSSIDEMVPDEPARAGLTVHRVLMINQAEYSGQLCSQYEQGAVDADAPSQP